MTIKQILNNLNSEYNHIVGLVNSNTTPNKTIEKIYRISEQIFELLELATSEDEKKLIITLHKDVCDFLSKHTMFQEKKHHTEKEDTNKSKKQKLEHSTSKTPIFTEIKNGILHFNQSLLENCLQEEFWNQINLSTNWDHMSIDGNLLPRKTIEQYLKLGITIHPKNIKTVVVKLEHYLKKTEKEILQFLNKDEHYNNQIEKSKNTKTILMYASSENHYDTCKVLLDNAIPVNQTDNENLTALHYAVSNEHHTICTLLLSHKADVNMQGGKDGITPLMLATSNGNQIICELLLLNKADIDMQSKDGITPPMMAAASGNQIICKLLLLNNADVNIQDKYGRTALMLAVQKGHTSICELLILNKADVNIQEKYERTALMMAASNGNKIICELLLLNNADVNMQDNNGITALMVVAANGNKIICELLLLNNADVNIQEKYGGTALMAAAVNGNQIICKLLLDYNAQAEILNNDAHDTLYLLGVERPQNYKLIKNFIKSHIISINKENKDNYPFYHQYLKSVKILSHSLEIPGNSKFITQFNNVITFDRTGLNPNLPFIRFYKDIYSFFEKFNDLIPQTNLQKIKNAFKINSEYTDNIASKIQQTYELGEPVLSSTGFIDHAIVCVAMKNFVIICNRGTASRMPVDIFRISPDKLNKTEFFKNLSELKSQPEEQYKKFIFKTFGSIYLPKTDSDILLEKLTSLKYQIVGNCAWTSVEQAFLALLVLLEVEDKQKESAIDNSQLKTIVNKQKTIFNNFLIYQRTKLLKRYLELIKNHKQLTEYDLLSMSVAQFYDTVDIKTVNKTLREEANNLIQEVNEKYLK